MVGNLSRTAGRSSTGSRGSAGTAAVLDPQVPHDARAPTASAANEWTTEDDPRITPFGRFLRRTHLDELPQVLNILRGDLVGRRAAARAAALRRGAAPRRSRSTTCATSCGPGLTGWAQVKYGYAGDERDALEKLQYEFYYLRHQSLGLDARICARTRPRASSAAAVADRGQRRAPGRGARSSTAGAATTIWVASVAQAAPASPNERDEHEVADDVHGCARVRIVA